MPLFNLTSSKLSPPIMAQALRICRTFVATLSIVAASGSAVNARPAYCTEYWLEMWKTRTDTPRWSYVDLSYYARSGAHPPIPGYSSSEIAMYFAVLAIHNKQGLDLHSKSISLDALERDKKAGAMRYTIAQFLGLSVPTVTGDAAPDRCVYSQSSLCLERLTRRQLPEAEKMQESLVDAIRSGSLGDVPCKGGIEFFNSQRLR